MGKVMLVTSGKGGTGKSTVALNLGLSLAKEGKKAVVVELDSGLRCLDLMLGLDDIVFDLGDVLSGKCDAMSAVYAAYDIPNLSIIAAPARTDQMISENRFCQLCKYLAKSFDYIILDTPAGLGSALEVAAAASSLALIVTNISPVSVRDAEKAAQKLSGYGIKNMRLVVNMVPLEVGAKTILPDLDDVIDGVGAQLLSVIPEDELLSRSVHDRKKKETRKSAGALAFSNMAKRILGQDVPLLLR